MNLIDALKRRSAVQAVLVRLRKSRWGRRLIRRVVRVLDREVGSQQTEQAVAATARADDFNLRRASFRDRGPTPDLLEAAAAQVGNSVAWRVLPAATWIVFAAAQLEAGDRSGAERTVRTHISRLGTGGLETSLPVAAFARELGVRSPEIDRAAFVNDVLTRSREQNRFGELVAGKSVAVVGNGPGMLDAGRGSEIDAHDVVIRFNNFPNGYESDCGTRTDIWVRGAHKDVRDRPDIADFSLVLWEMDFSRNLIEHPTHPEILFRDALFAPDKLAYLDTETKRGLRDASDLILPSSGAQVIWALQQARGTLDGVDVYGFSSLDASDDYGHFFDNLGDMGVRHDVDAEGRFLRSLFGRPVAEIGANETIVFNCAYREYDPARGRTGGPAGVLATQQLALGDAHRGHELVYIFDEGDKGALKRSLPHFAAGLTGKPVDLILGAEYVRRHGEIQQAISANKRILMVCHDLGSALGANLLGVPYVIVYHQQGSTIREMVSIGREPTDHETAAVTQLEERICSGARKMYFPSIGAREAFKGTADAALASKVTFADYALYNTLTAVDHGETEQALSASVRREHRLPDPDADIDVFMSVGDWNGDKGLDRVPALLDAYAARTRRKVLWIAIGSASDRARFQRARHQQKEWTFDSRLIGERLTHDRLLALLDYADYYVMMQRTSIFDLATLEAMRAGKGIILTPVGGNPEFNRSDNVEFVTEETFDDAVDTIALRDKAEWGAANRAVFEEHFSLDRFAGRYREMLDEQLALMTAESTGR